jgi:2-phospho-L-lactate transferase/gluconeogenesis factor (CofD/UPF0052 family)
LKGHSLGNLIVAAMFEMTGDFDQACAKPAKFWRFGASFAFDS